jgi:hypothetical protein
MKKYKCSGCSKPCFIQVEDEADCPIWCAYAKGEITDWCEVEEVVTDCNQLPDWCKVGEWYYDKVIKQYLQIDSFDMAHKARWGQDLKNGVIVQARKRPFNAEEMRELVGKVIQDNIGNRSLINNYTNVDNQVTVFCAYCNADKLMKAGYTIDGKPCYKLEHLENGEWVE